MYMYVCSMYIVLHENKTDGMYCTLPPAGDGSAVCWRVGEPACGQVTRLTGPELDSVTSVRQAGGLVYTSCRDGCVRVYSCTHID